jgi:hypothetical protein
LIGDFLEIIRGSRLLLFAWLNYIRVGKKLILNKKDKCGGAGSRNRWHRGVGNKSPQEARSHDTGIILMNCFPAFKVFAQSDGLIF